jgi:hypothetical protein
MGISLAAHGPTPLLDEVYMGVSKWVPSTTEVVPWYTIIYITCAYYTCIHLFVWTALSMHRILWKRIQRNAQRISLLEDCKVCAVYSALYQLFSILFRIEISILEFKIWSIFIKKSVHWQNRADHMRADKMAQRQKILFHNQSLFYIRVQ